MEIPIENYRAMIAQQALAAWWRLPPQTRSWLSPEDLIAAGYVRFYRTRELYDPQRHVKFGTYLFRSLHNFYLQHYVYRHHAQCRYEGDTIAIGDEQLRMVQSGYSVGMDEALSHLGVYQNENYDVDVALTVMTLLRLHSRAAPSFQKELERWFLSSRRRRYKPNRIVRKRFLALAQQHGITYQGCLRMMASPQAMERLSMGMRGKPYFKDKRRHV